MKANELRIGNIVYNPTLGEQRSIDCLDIRDLFEGRLWRPFEPIPLTSEWLLRFGFIKKDIVWRDKSISKECYQKGWYYVQFDEVTFFCKKSADQENIFLAHIQYVHQLQNLYFALTGEELQLTTQQQPNNTTPDS